MLRGLFDDENEKIQEHVSSQTHEYFLHQFLHKSVGKSHLQPFKLFQNNWFNNFKKVYNA